MCPFIRAGLFLCCQAASTFKVFSLISASCMAESRSSFARLVIARFLCCSHRRKKLEKNELLMSELAPTHITGPVRVLLLWTTTRKFAQTKGNTKKFGEPIEGTHRIPSERIVCAETYASLSLTQSLSANPKRFTNVAFGLTGIREVFLFTPQAAFPVHP